MEEQLVEKGLYNPESDNETSILALEQAILGVGSNLNVAQGVFYVLPTYSNGKLFVRYVKKYNPLIHNQSIFKQPANNILVTHVFHFRYMENGYCKGFLPHALQILKTSIIKLHLAMYSLGKYTLQRTSNCIQENRLKRQQVTKPTCMCTYVLNSFCIYY